MALSATKWRGPHSGAWDRNSGCCSPSAGGPQQPQHYWPVRLPAWASGGKAIAGANSANGSYVAGAIKGAGVVIGGMPPCAVLQNHAPPPARGGQAVQIKSTINFGGRKVDESYCLGRKRKRRTRGRLPKTPHILARPTPINGVAGAPLRPGAAAPGWPALEIAAPTVNPSADPFFHRIGRHG
jgi:hypothetical protein